MNGCYVGLPTAVLVSSFFFIKYRFESVRWSKTSDLYIDR